MDYTSYKKYYFYTVLFFILELFFVFAETHFILRNYLTDIFAVMYLYFFFRSCKMKVFTSLVTTFVISYCIEISQYFNVFKEYNGSWVSELVFGSTFDFCDLLAYNIGLGICIIIELIHSKKLPSF